MQMLLRNGVLDSAPDRPLVLDERVEAIVRGLFLEQPVHRNYLLSLNPAGIARSASFTVVATLSTSLVMVMNVARAPEGGLLRFAALRARPPITEPTGFDGETGRESCCCCC